MQQTGREGEPLRTWLYLELLKNALVQGSMFALLAVAFNCVYRTTRVFHVAIAVPLLLWTDT